MPQPTRIQARASSGTSICKDSTSRDSRVWCLYLVLGTILTAAYFVPVFQASSALYNILALSAVAAMMAGARRNGPSNPASWRLLACGMFCLALGEVVWTFYEEVLHLSVPFPSIADAFYLGGYPLLALGLAVMVRSREPDGTRDDAGLIDATVVAIGAGVLSWVFFVSPYMDDPSLTALGVIATIAYPLADVLLLAVLSRLLFSGVGGTFALYLLVGGLSAMLAANVVYAAQALGGTYTSGDPVDAGWLISYVLIGAAALHPSMAVLNAPAGGLPREQRVLGPRMALLIATPLAAPAVLLLQYIRGEQIDVPVIFASSVGLFLLVSFRMVSLTSRLQRCRGEERFEALVENSSDIVAILDASGTVRYVSPSCERILGYAPGYLVNKSSFAPLHSGDASDFENHYAQVLRNPGVSPAREFRVRHVDGSWRHMELIANNLTADPGIEGVVINARDVTGRKEAEENLRYRFDFERIIANTSTKFVDLVPEEVDSGIEEALREIGEFAGADRSYLFLCSEDVEVMENTHEWCAADIEPQIENLKGLAIDAFPWAVEKFRKGEANHVPRVADLPVEAAAEKEECEAEGIRSFVQIPMLRGDSLVGFIGFDSVRAERRWSEDEITLLGTVGDLFTNVLERRRAQRALQKAEGEYRSLIENIPAVTYIHPAGESENLSYMSPQVESVLGYTAEEYISQPGFWRERLHPDDKERVLAEDERSDQTLEPFSVEYRLKSSQGNYVWVREEAVVVRDEAGTPRYWQGFLWDIADRKEAEERLQEAERLYRTLIEQIPVVTYIQELERKEDETTFMSPQIERITGYTPEDFTSDPALWVRAIHLEDFKRVAAEDERTDQTGERYCVEYRMLHKDGRVVWVRDEAVIVHDAEGEPLHWRGIMQDITAQKELENELSHQASHDSLTELPNRALFTDRLEHALTLGDRQERSLAVMFVDLDNFKNVNDSLGHAAGDQLLREVATRLSCCVRPSDTVARLGGDEFAVLLEELPKEISNDLQNPFQDTGEGWSAAGAAIRVARRILESLERPFTLGEKEVHVRPSIGIATDTGEKWANDLLRNADVAMYTAKSRGKGRYEFYDPAMHAATLERLQLASDLRRAVARKEFIVHYQPIVSLGGEEGESGQEVKVSQVEALVRWEHPEKGMIPPANFIPLAEETGDIVAIGLLVLEEACTQVQRWREGYPEADRLTLSVNLSARQFRESRLAENVCEILQKTGLPAPSLKLEITESTAMEDVEAALVILRKLRALGVKIAVDDFGTGYSSLSHLSRFPVDTLKVDRSFVNRLHEDPESAAIISTTVTLAQELGLSTTAEGVESAEQLAQLRKMGCDHAQGYYFAKPMPLEEVRKHFDVVSIPSR